MAVKVRKGGALYLYIRPFGKQLGIRVHASNKTEAELVESMILRACRTGNYALLVNDPLARETCIRMFITKRWKLPPELDEVVQQRKEPEEELTLWRAEKLFLQYPTIRGCKSVTRYEYCLANLTAHFGKDRVLTTIRKADLAMYQTERLKQDARPATVNWETAALSKLFSIMAELELVETNPVKGLSQLSVKDSQRSSYLSFQDVQRIIEKCPAMIQPIAWVAYYSGMRQKEILQLSWKDVDLGKRLIVLGSERTKEGRFKRVPIHPELVSVFEQCKSAPVVTIGRIFKATKDQVTHLWAKACDAVGMDPRPWFHDLRHSWRANARRSNMSDAIAEMILGHSDRDKPVSQRYGFVSDQELIDAVDGMSFNNGDTAIYGPSRRREKAPKKEKCEHFVNMERPRTRKATGQGG